MKVLFKHPRCIDGVDYHKGEHVLPDSLASHWYFLACVANNAATITEAPEPEPPVEDDEDSLSDSDDPYESDSEEEPIKEKKPKFKGRRKARE